MTFQLALAGTRSGDPRVTEQLSGILTRLKEELEAQGDDVSFQLLVSPSYTAEDWKPWIKKADSSVWGLCMAGDTRWDGDCNHILREETPLRALIGEELCDSADLLLMVWDEDTASFGGATWELLQLAHSRKTPCIWISSKTGSVFWSEDSYYELCQPRHIEELGAMFCLEDAQPQTAGQKRIFLLELGMALRRRYMRRHAALGGRIDAERDELLADDYSMEQECPGSEAVRRRLLSAFHKFDDAAIDLNQRYQGVIYWRAILPFITSMFLALGFYAENVLGIIPGTSAGFWIIVAGFGFLLHGLMNLYVYILSRNETIKGWHKGSLNNRYIAEILRVLIHFAPYGIHLNLRRLCGGDPQVYMTVLRLVGREDQGNQEVGKASTIHMLDHVEQMLEDQIAYHTISHRRNSGIVEKLEAWYRRAFMAGFAAVVLRAVFQAVLALWPITSGSLNGVPLQKFAGSFANMVALMLPGWASYFSTKLELCNFRYNAENHAGMIDRLTGILQRIRNMRGSVQDIPLEAMSTLGEELAEVMILEDTSAWYNKYKGATIKHL